MEKELFFHILGMEETKKEGEIRKAYREKLKRTNPEDDPEGFKRLRQAYEEAVAFAGEKENSRGPAGEIGRWMEKVDRLYRDLEKCRMPELWERLLAEPICEGLDTSLEVRERLLGFLMKNIYLPHRIWGLIDGVFRITDDMEALEKQYPANFLRLVKYFVENENFLPYGLFRYRQPGRKKADRNAYITGYLDIRQQTERGEARDLLQRLEELAAYNVYHPYEEVERVRIWVKLGQTEEAEKRMEQLLQEYPEDLYIGTYAGELLWQRGKKKQAYRHWEQVLKKNPDCYDAKYGAARYLMEAGEGSLARDMVLELLEQNPYQEELAGWLHTANEAVIEELRAEPGEIGAGGAEPSEEEMPEAAGEEAEPEEKGASAEAERKRRQAIKLGWCLFQNERLDELGGFLDSMPFAWKDTYDYGILYGKFLQCRERYEEALPYLQKWLDWAEACGEDGARKSRLRNSARCRANVSLGGCYAELGRMEEGEAYIRRAVALAEGKNEKAEYRRYFAAILLKKEAYGKAADVCSEIIRDNEGFYPAYLLRQEANYKLGKAQAVINDYRQAVSIYAGYYRPYLLAAEVFLDYGQYGDALHVLETAAANRTEFTPQMKLCEIRLRRGLAKNRGDRAEIRKRLEALQEELKEETGDLEDRSEVEYEQGLLWWEDGKLKEALACMERAMEQNPDCLQYKMACGEIRWEMQKYEKAFEKYMAAQADYANNAGFYMCMGYMYESHGEIEQAKEEFREALARNPYSAECRQALERCERKSG